MKKAVPTTSQLELIKNFKFTIKKADSITSTVSGSELDTDIAEDFLKTLDILNQFYKLSKTTKFKYGQPVDQFDLHKVFSEISLHFDPTTGMYYKPMFKFKKMGLSYLISFITTVRHEQDMDGHYSDYSATHLIDFLTRILKFVKDEIAVDFRNIEGLPVITVRGESLNFDVERFEEKEESSGEGLNYLFDGSKVPFRYKDLSPHFTKYIINVISKQIRRMAKRGEIDARTTSFKSGHHALLRGGKVIRRTKKGQPITAEVQVNFLRAVLDDLLYNEGGEDIVRQIASLDKKEFDEFMKNKQYNRSLTTIFTQFVNVAIKENLNKLGYFDPVAQRFRGDSSLVAKSNVTENFFNNLEVGNDPSSVAFKLKYDKQEPMNVFRKIIEANKELLINYLIKQIPVSVVTIELKTIEKNLVVIPIFRTFSDTSEVEARVKFVLDFEDQRIYYHPGNYTSTQLKLSNFKQKASSISMDLDDPLRNLITLLGQLTKPDKVSSRAFGGKNKTPEHKSLELLKQIVAMLPKKNIIKIEGPEYNSLLGTITGGLLLGVYNASGDIINSLTYLSFDSIRTRRASKSEKSICMVRLVIKREVDNLGSNRYFLIHSGSNCIYTRTDLSTGDTVGTVVSSIVDSLKGDPINFELSRQANISAALLYNYVEKDPAEIFMENRRKLTKEILKIPLEDMDDLLFRKEKIELKITDGEDKDE